MTGYKAIIKNMVDAEVTRFVKKQSGKFIEVNSVELNTNKECDTPTFKVDIMVGLGELIRRDFQIHGYVSEYGSVEITHVSFDRMYQESVEDKPTTKNTFMMWNELKDFHFDR